MTAVRLPISNKPGTTTVALNGRNYIIRTDYADTDEGGWFIDINDARGNPLVCGVPLVTGADLLEQYAYLGIGGRLFVATDGDPDAVPTFTNLGIESHLYFEPF